MCLFHEVWQNNLLINLVSGSFRRDPFDAPNCVDLIAGKASAATGRTGATLRGTVDRAALRHRRTYTQIAPTTNHGDSGGGWGVRWGSDIFNLTSLQKINLPWKTCLEHFYATNDFYFFFSLLNLLQYRELVCVFFILLFIWEIFKKSFKQWKNSIPCI